jgi:SAM-dependent methyltransferase
VIEVGAGPGFLSSYARERRPDLRWTATDIVPVPWNQVAADAERLPFGDGAAEAIVGLDVLHHLGRPAEFLAEAARVVRPGGPLAMVEPWVTALSYPIYRWLHQEGCTPGLDPWDPFPRPGSGRKEAFDGDAAVPWKLLKRVGETEWNRRGFERPAVTILNGFAYVMSLGFREASLLPARLVSPLLALDRRFQRWSPLLGLRALLVWRRLPSPRTR